jgi:hypothetical protein
MAENGDFRFSIANIRLSNALYCCIKHVYAFKDVLTFPNSPPIANRDSRVETKCSLRAMVGSKR